jgi:1,4-alpha-glucan branching enzyme
MQRTMGDVDLYLLGEGKHERAWERLGAHVEGGGVRFAVWAPNARGVSVVGDWNQWDGRVNRLQAVGDSGIWDGFVDGIGEGTFYKYEIQTPQGPVLRSDPFAFATEVPPGTASKVYVSHYEWQDSDWLEARAAKDPLRSPMSIYEVHLGSWRRPASYRDVADHLADYCERMGFTHVQFLPLAEHPFGGSWGYQVGNYYAPSARWGDPDDLRFLIDRLHQRGIGVLIDWVPAHFPKDEYALRRFDGSALYEHEDPRKGEHPDWGTMIFNYGRHEVRNFLLANALYWLEEYHVDGLRVDAVASMLYLDYSRNEGEWVPNAYGGRENLEAIDFLRQLNTLVHGRHPGAVCIAEESTAWPGVSRPVYTGGLGFTFKWNMGWMHDTLSYMSLDPIYRRFNHDKITFGMLYAWSENFVLPLSHDEVVHLKGSLVGKMPGDTWQKFANLRALYGHMWAHPGKKLLFMGGEIGQWHEWNEAVELDWNALGNPQHAGIQRLVADLNRVYRAEPALWEADVIPEGFQWIDPHGADANVASYVRWAPGSERHLVCVANFSPVVRDRYKVGVPQTGVYREVMNTDASFYGGSNVGNGGAVAANPEPWGYFPATIDLTLPPLGVVWLVPESQAN